MIRRLFLLFVVAIVVVVVNVIDNRKSFFWGSHLQRSNGLRDYPPQGSALGYSISGPDGPACPGFRKGFGGLVVDAFSVVDSNADQKICVPAGKPIVNRQPSIVNCQFPCPDSRLSTTLTALPPGAGILPASTRRTIGVTSTSSLTSRAILFCRCSRLA